MLSQTSLLIFFFVILRGAGSNGDSLGQRSPVEGNVRGQVWWCTAIIPALGRQRQEEGKFEASLVLVPLHFLPWSVTLRQGGSWAPVAHACNLSQLLRRQTSGGCSNPNITKKIKEDEGVRISNFMSVCFVSLAVGLDIFSFGRST
jgi:hypothetical protein